MAWLAVDVDGTEKLCAGVKPTRQFDDFSNKHFWVGREIIVLPKGAVRAVLGRELTWNDEPVEFTEVE